MTIVEFKPDLTDAGLGERFYDSERHQSSQSDKQRSADGLRIPNRSASTAISAANFSSRILAYLGCCFQCGLASAKHLQQYQSRYAHCVKNDNRDIFPAVAVGEIGRFFTGRRGIPYRLYEQFLANTNALAAKFGKGSLTEIRYADGRLIRSMGFDQEEAMLQQTPRSFNGYRILQEYFAFPERYLFVEFNGLAELIVDCDSEELELFVLLNRSDAQLINALDKSNFALFCTPAINLFPKRSDRIHIDHRQSEYHIVVDRTRPMDYEVFSVSDVAAYGVNQNNEQSILPFYGSKSAYQNLNETAFFSLRRQKRILSAKQRREGVRSSFIGSELFISLVDSAQAPYASSITQLGLETLCSNRDLPLVMPVGVGETDFNLQISSPVKSIRCIAGPTRPIPAAYEGDTIWRLINHLSLNYLSLLDTDPKTGAASLRELLRLYADNLEPAVKKQYRGGNFG